VLYAAPFGSSRLAGRPELGGAALDGVAVRALKVAAAAREGCRNARGDVVLAERPVEPVGVPLRNAAPTDM
jgi:5-enolpyruvylshikimate-3-phosphate synthase